MAFFYLQFVNGTIIGKTLLLVAGLFCFHVFLASAHRLEIVRLGQWSKHKRRLEIRNDWLAHHLKRTTKKLRMPCAKLALNLQQRTSWSAYDVRISNTGNVQR